MTVRIPADATAGKAASPDELAALCMRYFRERDLDGLVSLYEPEAYVQPEPGTVLHGTDAICTALGEILDAGPQVTLDLRSIHMAEGIALVTNILTLTAPDGTVHREIVTEVQRRQADGRWLYVFDIVGGLPSK